MLDLRGVYLNGDRMNSSGIRSSGNAVGSNAARRQGNRHHPGSEEGLSAGRRPMHQACVHRQHRPIRPQPQPHGSGHHDVSGLRVVRQVRLHSGEIGAIPSAISTGADQREPSLKGREPTGLPRVGSMETPGALQFCLWLPGSTTQRSPASRPSTLQWSWALLAVALRAPSSWAWPIVNTHCLRAYWKT